MTAAEYTNSIFTPFRRDFEGNHHSATPELAGFLLTSRAFWGRTVKDERTTATEEMQRHRGGTYSVPLSTI